MTYLVYLMVFALANLFCGKDDTPDNPIVPPQYESCCGTEPVEYENAAAGTYVYFPNVFTPNGDGVNDLFYPHFDATTGVVVRNFTIYSVVNDTIIFTKSWFLPNALEDTAWNGMRSDGSVYEGEFRYFATLDVPSGHAVDIEGRACRIVCGPDAAVFKTLEGCFYSEQAGTDGHLDASKTVTESMCFQ